MKPMGLLGPLRAECREIANLKPGSPDRGAAGREISSLKPMGAGPGSSRRLSRAPEACGPSGLGSSREGNREPEAYRVSGPGRKSANLKPMGLRDLGAARR